MLPLDHMLTYVLEGLAALSLLWNLVLHAAARIKLRRRRPCASSFAPPISVLKPLCGLDVGLYENLESFARQQYPNFELVFGVEDSGDPALSVVWRLRRAYPHVRMHIAVGTGRLPAVNPKVRNLLQTLEVAEHEHILVSDSNVLAPPDYLASVVSELADPTVGLASNPIVGIAERSVGAGLENLHLNTLVLGSICFADLLGQPCVIGKSMLMRRSELESLGGFEALRDVLAEDFVLGRKYHDAGYAVVLSPRLLYTRNIELPIGRFWARHLRWAQLRRWVAPALFACEGAAYLTPWLCAVTLSSGFGGSLREAAIASSVALGVRLASDLSLNRFVSGRRPLLIAVLCAPLKDFAMLVAWGLAWLRRSVTWRGHALRIGTGTRVTCVRADSLLQAQQSANT